MSGDIATPGFKAGTILAELAKAFESMSEDERKELVKKTNGLFQLNIKNADGEEGIWVIDAKKEGKVVKGADKKPDAKISMSDDTFAQLADGKLNGQKAFMTGKLKVAGQIMLATKLDGILKAAKSKL